MGDGETVGLKGVSVWVWVVVGVVVDGAAVRVLCVIDGAMLVCRIES